MAVTRYGIHNLLATVGIPDNMKVGSKNKVPFVGGRGLEIPCLKQTRDFSR